MAADVEEVVLSSSDEEDATSRCQQHIKPKNIVGKRSRTVTGAPPARRPNQGRDSGGHSAAVSNATQSCGLGTSSSNAAARHSFTLASRPGDGANSQSVPGHTNQHPRTLNTFAARGPMVTCQGGSAKTAPSKSSLAQASAHSGPQNKWNQPRFSAAAPTATPRAAPSFSNKPPPSFTAPCLNRTQPGGGKPTTQPGQRQLPTTNNFSPRIVGVTSLSPPADRVVGGRISPSAGTRRKLPPVSQHVRLQSPAAATTSAGCASSSIQNTSKPHCVGPKCSTTQSRSAPVSASLPRDSFPDNRARDAAAATPYRATPPLIELDVTPPKKPPPHQKHSSSSSSSPRYTSKKSAPTISKIPLTPRKIASIHKKSFTSGMRAPPKGGAAGASGKVNMKEHKEKYDPKKVAELKNKLKTKATVQTTLKNVFPVAIPLGWKDDHLFAGNGASKKVVTTSENAPPPEKNEVVTDAPDDSIVTSSTEPDVGEVVSTSPSATDAVPAPSVDVPRQSSVPTGEASAEPVSSTSPDATTDEAASTPARKRKMTEDAASQPADDDAATKDRTEAPKKKRRIPLSSVLSSATPLPTSTSAMDADDVVPSSTRASTPKSFDILEIGHVDRSEDVVVIQRKRRRPQSEGSASATDYTDSDSNSSISVEEEPSSTSALGGGQDVRSESIRDGTGVSARDAEPSTNGTASPAGDSSATVSARSIPSVISSKSSETAGLARANESLNDPNTSTQTDRAEDVAEQTSVTDQPAAPNSRPPTSGGGQTGTRTDDQTPIVVETTTTSSVSTPSTSSSSNVASVTPTSDPLPENPASELAKEPSENLAGRRCDVATPIRTGEPRGGPALTISSPLDALEEEPSGSSTDKAAEGGGEGVGGGVGCVEEIESVPAEELVGNKGMDRVLGLAKTLLTRGDSELINFARISFEKADPAFTASMQFAEVIKNTLFTMMRDSSNIFVHIKELITHLKRNKLKKKGKTKILFTKLSSDEEREASPAPAQASTAKTVEASKLILGKLKILNNLKGGESKTADKAQSAGVQSGNDAETSEGSTAGVETGEDTLFTDVSSPAAVEKVKKGLVVGGKKSLRDSVGSGKQLERLYQLLERVEREILRLEEKELDLDDLKDMNSYHIQEAKLKAKAVQIWKAICKIEERNPDDIGRINKRKFIYKGSRFKEINRAISRFVTDTHEFPDYGSIKGLVEKANEKFNLNLRPNDVHDTAKEVFVEVGELLQARRHTDFVVDFGCRLVDEFREEHGSDDPAVKDADLAAKLTENAKIAKKRTDEVFQQFVKKQDNDHSSGVIGTVDPTPSTSTISKPEQRTEVPAGDDAVEDGEEDDDDEEDEESEEKEQDRLTKILDNCEEDEDEGSEQLICWKKS